MKSLVGARVAMVMAGRIVDRGVVRALAIAGGSRRDIQFGLLVETQGRLETWLTADGNYSIEIERKPKK